MSTSRLGEGEKPSEIETRASAFLAEARSIPELSDREIGAIRRRLLEQRQVRRRPYLLPVVAALAVLLAGGTVMAVVGGWRPRLPRFGAERVDSTSVARQPHRPGASASRSFDRAPRALEEHTLEEKAPPRPTPLLKGAASTSNQLESAKPLATMGMRPAPAEGAALFAGRSIRREQLARTERPSSIARVEMPGQGGPPSEARSLSEALASWRRNNDAEGALALLEAHERRFARGAFSVEAKVARAEILLAIGRRPQALQVLDSLNLAALPRARELQTVRGELRSQAGRCLEAREDLGRVLTESSSDEFGQRATRAFAKCP